MQSNKFFMLALGERSAAARPTPIRSKPSEPEKSVDDVKVRGIAIAPVRDFIDKEFGATSWPHYLQIVGPQAREVLESPVTSMGWYPFSVGLSLVDGMMKLACGQSRVLRSCAFHMLDFATNAIFRAIFKIGSPEFMIARSDHVWRHYYSHGRVICSVTKGRARISLYDFPFATASYKRLVLHSMEAVIVKSGGKLRRMELSEPTELDKATDFLYEW